MELPNYESAVLDRETLPNTRVNCHDFHKKKSKTSEQVLDENCWPNWNVKRNWWNFFLSTKNSRRPRSLCARTGLQCRDVSIDFLQRHRLHAFRDCHFGSDFLLSQSLKSHQISSGQTTLCLEYDPLFTRDRKFFNEYSFTLQTTLKFFQLS